RDELSGIVRYQERVAATLLFRWFLRLLILIPPALSLWTPLANDDQAIVAVISVVVLLVIVVLLDRWLMVLDVRVLRAEVQAAFGPFRKRIRASEIASVEDEAYRWTQYGGWGIRRGLQKRRAWTVPFLRTG